MTACLASRTVAVADLLPGFGNPWRTWEEVERDIRSRLCLCCSQPGHHQEKVESYMAAHGVDGMAVCVYDDMRVHDGHHRVLAARHLGIERLPLESIDDAGARWVRDHGAVDWTRRRLGDMTPGEASWVVTDALMKAAGTPLSTDDRHDKQEG